MIIVIFGVSGAGKTTVGKMLAEQLGWRFLEADDFHPAANIEKMRNPERLSGPSDGRLIAHRSWRCAVIFSFPLRIPAVTMSQCR